MDVYRLAITLPRLADAEIQSLLAVMDSKRATFPVFTAWVSLLLIDERDRRKSGDREPVMHQVPSWSGHDFSDVLCAAFVFNRLPLSENQHHLLDDVGMKITAAAVAIIDHHLSEVIV